MNIRSGFCGLIACAAVQLTSHSAFATTVTVLDTASSPFSGFVTLGNFTDDQDPLGQTFTLSQSHNNLQIGGVIRDINQLVHPTLDIIISLYSGAGFGGPMLGSVSFTLADGFDGLVVKDFSFVGTVAAGIYTAGFSSGASARGSLGITDDTDPNTDPYNEFGLFSIQGFSPFDFRVFVSGDTVSDVPLPAALPLYLAGLAGLGFANRAMRRKSA